MKREAYMNLKALAESIILQAMEDLDDPQERAECLDFFHGHRFRLLARMAGINSHDIMKFRAYTGQYMHPICANENPTRSDRKMLRSMAMASLKYRQPLFMHLMSRC
jgi:hypothetical protein